jgi:hypothetical protein
MIPPMPKDPSSLEDIPKAGAKSFPSSCYKKRKNRYHIVFIMDKAKQDFAKNQLGERDL